MATTTDRVREILSWYGSDSPGTLTNLSRMLNAGSLAGTGKMVILPVDQGFEHGPARSFAKNPAGYDPRSHFQLAIDAGCNAYAAPLGFLEAGAREFAGQIPLILKLNNHDVLYEEKDPEQAVTGSVRDALRLGCVGIGYTIYPGSSARLEMYSTLRALGEEAKANGLVVVVWSYPRGSAGKVSPGTSCSSAANSATRRRRASFMASRRLSWMLPLAAHAPSRSPAPSPALSTSATTIRNPAPPFSRRRSVASPTAPHPCVFRGGSRRRGSGRSPRSSTSPTM